MRARNRQEHGFTLIELLVVIVIIGIISSLLIPNLLDAMQKAKQKRTMADTRLVGTAMMSWLTDVSSAAAAGQVSTVDLGDYQGIDLGDLEAVLVPRYIQEVPPVDGWKFPFDYYLDAATASSALQVMGIRSGGRDGGFQGQTYEVTAFTPTDYNQDIVWVDGFFVRWPQNLQKNLL